MVWKNKVLENVVFKCTQIFEEFDDNITYKVNESFNIVFTVVLLASAGKLRKANFNYCCIGVRI